MRLHIPDHLQKDRPIHSSHPGHGHEEEVRINTTNATDTDESGLGEISKREESMQFPLTAGAEIRSLSLRVKRETSSRDATRELKFKGSRIKDPF